MAIKTIQQTTTMQANIPENDGVISLTKVEEARKSCNFTSIRDVVKQEIVSSGELDRLTSLIDLSNLTTIVEFGKEPASKMAQVADQVLSKYDMTQLNGTSKLIDSLLAVMKKIDLDELKDSKDLIAQQAKRSIFDKFKKSAQEKLDALVGKYKTLGGDMENICNQLVVYDQQIKSSNQDINKMYDQSIENYKELVTYVIAGEQACKEIEDYGKTKEIEFEQTGSLDLKFEIQNINQALNLMEQRVADLRGAETIALQSIPTFKIQEYTNSNLSRKINSAFIVTVPAFKTALVSSVIAKQQAIQAQGLSVLDEATSILVRKNADNAVQQLQNSQRLANTSAVKADDIEYAWNTIMTGIQQYKEMEIQYKDIRKEEARRIEEANSKYIESLSINN